MSGSRTSSRTLTFQVGDAGSRPASRSNLFISTDSPSLSDLIPKPLTLFGIPVLLDPTVPKGEIRVASRVIIGRRS